MGWKRIKDHYRIEHMVHVDDGVICIGSGYIPKLVMIWPDGRIVTEFNVENRPPLREIVAAMKADPDTLRRLIAEPDVFERSVSVYTYDDKGNIIEALCEVPGWPNVTHDGRIQYENRFSADPAAVVEMAFREITARRDHERANLIALAAKLDACRVLLAEQEEALIKLERMRKTEAAT
jgi:hypothetical protein